DLKILEDLLELGNHENHDHRDDADGDGNDHHRVDHGADDFLFELLGLFHEIGQTGENQVEHAAGFAGVHHVYIELVEGLWIFGHGIRQRAAAFDVVGHAADDGFHQAGLLLLFKNLKRAKDRQAGVLKRGKL